MHLPRLARSLGAFTLALTGMITACSLPPVRPLVAPQMQREAARPRTVAVLPPDLQVTVRDGKGRVHSDQVRGDALLHRSRRGLAESLHRRGYRVVSLVHNDTGALLWHAGQELQIEPHGSGNIERLIDHCLRALPRGTGSGLQAPGI